MGYCTNAANPEFCNLKVFVAWEGTDYNGNYLVSTSTHPSNFLSQNVPSYLQSQQQLKTTGSVNSRLSMNPEADASISANNK